VTWPHELYNESESTPFNKRINSLGVNSGGPPYNEMGKKVLNWG
jgi:hypothetical protein